MTLTYLKDLGQLSCRMLHILELPYWFLRITFRWTGFGQSAGQGLYPLLSSITWGGFSCLVVPLLGRLTTFSWMGGFISQKTKKVKGINFPRTVSLCLSWTQRKGLLTGNMQKRNYQVFHSLLRVSNPSFSFFNGENVNIWWTTNLYPCMYKSRWEWDMVCWVHSLAEYGRQFSVCHRKAHTATCPETSCPVHSLPL